MQRRWMHRCVERLYTVCCVCRSLTISYGLFISVRRNIQSGRNLGRHHWNGAWCHMCNWVFRRGHIYRCSAQSRGRISVRNLRDWEFRKSERVPHVHLARVRVGHANVLLWYFTVSSSSYIATLLPAKFRPNFASVTAPLQLQLNLHASDNIIDDTWRKTRAYTNNGNDKHTCATKNSLQSFSLTHTHWRHLWALCPRLCFSPIQ